MKQRTTLLKIYLIKGISNRLPTIFIQENFYVYMTTNLTFRQRFKSISTEKNFRCICIKETNPVILFSSRKFSSSSV